MTPVPGERLSIPASGDQVEIAAGPYRLTAVTVGGGIRELLWKEHAVLDGYGADEVAVGAYGQVLVPWPNRIAQGRYTFGGQTHQVELSEPAKGNAIHGFGRWTSWQVVSHDADRATLGMIVNARAGYPFTLRVEVEYAVGPDRGLTVTTVAGNAGSTALPVAIGFHPYVRVGTDRVDRCRLSIPGQTWLPSDDHGIPTGRSPVEGTDRDFREPRRIGATQLDTAYTDLIRDPDGLARVRLEAPDGSRSVSVWMDPAFGHVMAFTGDTLTDARRRRRSLGVEPMTAPPNAFQTGEDLSVLEAGESVTTTWGIVCDG
jgi:aldose 1-epimerase